jgi:hypothetical protein
MRLVFAALAAALIVVPARVHACGYGTDRTSPYANLMAVPSALLGLGLVLSPVASVSRKAAIAEVAAAGLSAVSFLAIGFSPDARSDGVKPMYLAAGVASALVVAHGVWMASGGERPVVELSGGTGVGRGTLGGQMAFRYAGFGAHLGAGLPLGTGNQGVSGGVSWIGAGRIAPLLALNAALQILPDGAAYFRSIETRSLMSFSFDAGVRFRFGSTFLDVAAGPVAQRLQVTSSRFGTRGSGWTTGVSEAGSGAWPLPVDVSLAFGREL